ncbi:MULTISPECIES: hypothetical protein [unclassified Afipia]|uniref:hypothetical protein n=1 Tax=unclassified Afipia TaxID=2642050 RepID=UPI0003F88AE2|nr:MULTISPECIES: hypothetical protein [unclassified Afipia]
MTAIANAFLLAPLCRTLHVTLAAARKEFLGAGAACCSRSIAAMPASIPGTLMNAVASSASASNSPLHDAQFRVRKRRKAAHAEANYLKLRINFYNTRLFLDWDQSSLRIAQKRFGPAMAPARHGFGS